MIRRGEKMIRRGEKMIRRGEKMIKKLLQVLKIRQKDKRESEDYQARQETYKQIKEAREYIY